MKLLKMPNSGVMFRETYAFEYDFDQATDTNRLTVTATDSGSLTIADGKNGVGVLAASDGTVADNDESYILTKYELFKIEAGKPAYFETRIKFTEANTDDANVALGFMNAVAANSIQDNGAGPQASFSGGVFYKIDGELTWNVRTSIGTTKTTTAISKVATAGDGTYRRFGIELVPTNASKFDAYYMIDGEVVAKHTDIAYSGATEMHAFIGLKNGGGTAETLSVDYMNAYQSR